MKREKKFGLIVATLLIFIVVMAVSLNFLLESAAFHNFAIRKITEAAEEATGGKTQIGGLDFRLSALTAHLYNVTVRGRESADSPPLLHVDDLTVGFKIQSVLRRKIYLSDLEIIHPVVHFEVDRKGKSNAPQSSSSQTGSSSSVFDMAVRHLLMTNGEINYNDQTIPMNADLYDLGANIHFDLLSNRYSGSISYDNGHIKYAQYASLTHSLHSEFSATPSELTLQPAEIKVGSSSATLHVSVTNYSRPNLDGDYNVVVHTQDFAAFAPGTKPAGDILLKGKIGGSDLLDRPLLKALVIDGEISSNDISAAASSGRIEARKLRGKFGLANGALQASGINLESLGGILRADVDMQHLDSTPSTEVRASFHGISLQAAQQALRRPELRQVALSGILDGKSGASWTGSLQNIRASADLTLRAESQNRQSRKSVRGSPTISMPVDGVIHMTYEGQRNAIGLRSSTLHIPSAVMTAQGEISDRSNLQIQSTVSDLRQIVALLSAFRPNSQPPPLVSGSATLNATIRGSVKRPEIAGELAAENLIVQGSDWRSAQAHLEANPSRVSITNASLTSAQRGHATFSATVALRDWSYLPSDSLNANLSVQLMSIADLEHIANANYPASGDLSGQITLSGSQLNPQGSGKVQVSNGSAYGESFKSVDAQFHTDSGSIKSSLNVVLAAAGTAHADLTFTPNTKAYTVRLDAPAIVMQKLSFVQAKNLPLSGTLTVSANGAGTLDDPQLTAVIGIPKLTVRDKSISDMKAELKVADHKAGFNLSSQIVNASVNARGQVNLTGDYNTEATLDTNSVPLDVLLATYLPSLPEGFKGQTEFHATLKGPLKDPSQLEAHLTIPALDATYSSLQIGAAGPIRADYAHSVITIQPAELRGTGTSLHLQGSIPLAGNSSSTLSAQGTIDVRIAEVFLPDTKSAGTISLDVHASGTPQQPNVSGQVRLQDVSVLQSGAPLGIEKLNGTLGIDNERIHLTGLTGQVGGGTLSAGGSVAYRPSMQFNVALEAHSIRLRYPDGIRSLLDGNLALTGTKDSSVLNGRVLIDSLSFTPDFDLAKFADQFSSQTATPVQPGFADTVQLSVAVQSQENLSATSSQISIAGRVNLHVGGTASDPIITGRTDLTSGEMFYRNVRYQLQRGIITFEDPNQTSPILNVAVTSTVEQYNLTLNLRGPFDKLTTSYVSDPPLATADVINLLATGQTTQQSSSSQSTDSILASQAAGQFSGSVQKLAGLSSLQIDPLIGGSNQNPSARIAVQQRVTKNFLFTFSTDVSQPGSEIVEGDYQINKRWSVSVARQEAGGISAEGRLHTKF